jgi:AAA family ATP:ADP antiporter
MSEKQSLMARVFPISKNEFPKFLWSSLLMMLTIYIYSILRGTKDAMLIAKMGAEIISTVKLWGVTTSAILFMLLYTKIVDLFTRTNLYHLINGFFMGFFILFLLLLYPNLEAICPDTSGLIESMPYLKYFFLMVAGWPYALFYIFSELFGSVMLSLMFWQLMNQITSIEESKRFYPLFGFFAQFGLGMAGILSSSLSKNNAGWDQSLTYITMTVVGSGLFMSIAVEALSKLVGKDEVNGVKKAGGKKKVKMGFGESLKYVMSSKYIGLITLLILCYGVSINLVEGLWKKSMNIYLPDPNSYIAFNGYIQTATALATALAMLSGSYLLRALSWRTAAILTPIIILATGIPFFIFMVMRENLEATLITYGVSAIAAAVIFGGIQNILSKATKYSFFDPTKEMSYIPLDDDLKSKGKAAADVIGGRLGKSGGALIQFTLLSLMPGANLLSLAPSMFGIFIVIMIVWLFAVFGLAKEFKIKSEEAKKEG